MIGRQNAAPRFMNRIAVCSAKRLVEAGVILHPIARRTKIGNRPERREGAPVLLLDVLLQ